jgi:hypothetical protein
MPDVDLSPAVPASASWVKLRYEISGLKPDARLIARLWSADVKEAVVIQGASGDVFVKLKTPQKLSYQHPVDVRLKLKVTAYKDSPFGSEDNDLLKEPS